MSSKSSKNPKAAKAVPPVEDAVDETNPGFQVLRFGYGSPTNVVLFKESAYDFCCKHVGDSAQIIRTTEYYVPPEIPALAEGADADAIDAHRYETRERIKHINELRREERKLYSYIWCNCSKESQEQIARHPLQAMTRDGVLRFQNADGAEVAADAVGAQPVMEDWENIRTSANVLSLIRRINETHIIQPVGVAIFREQMARDHLHNVKMHVSETIINYKQRFDNCVAGFASVGLEAPAQPELALRFVKGLDDSRFAQFKIERENWARNGVLDYPATVQAAYEAACTWRIQADAATVTTGTAFTTVQPRKGKKNGKPAAAAASPASSPAAVSAPSVATPAPASAQSGSASSKKAPPRPCSVCEGNHWIKDCPIVLECKKKQSNQKAVHVAIARASLSVDGDVIKSSVVGDPLSVGLSSAVANVADSKTTIQLDNQASISIFRDVHLLGNVRPVPPCEVTGIATTDHPIVATEVGEFNGWKDIYACREASANLISFSATKAYCSNTYDADHDVFISSPPGGQQVEFHERNGLYVHDLKPAKALATNADTFTSKQIAAAEKAKELSRALGYPSPQSLVDLINAGGIINCPVTAHDVARAKAIFGPDLGALRGKSRKKKVKISPMEFLPREVASDQTLHVDIMFLGGIAFLISVSTPLGLTAVTELGRTKGSRSLASVKAALLDQLALYSSRSFNVVGLLTDAEGSVIALQAVLAERGILMNRAGSGSHVPIIERKIQEVKERCRAIINTLPYRLPLTLVPYLVLFAVTRINWIPHRVGMANISPSEAFLGRKLDFKRDLRVGFGEYCEVFDPSSDNTMRPRTQAAISLGPTGNLSGSVRFYRLATGKEIVRDQFTVMPMSDVVIKAMNILADAASARVHDFNIEPINGGFTAEELERSLAEYRPATHFPSLEMEDPPRSEVAFDPVDDNFPVVPPAPQPQLGGGIPVDEPVVAFEDVHPEPAAAEAPLAEAPLAEIPRHYRTNVNGGEMVLRPRRANIGYARVFNISVKQALKTMPEQALASMLKELTQLHEKSVFKPIPASVKPTKKVIKSFMFLKEKFFSDGTFDKLKSRLVAGGHMQDRSEVLYEDIASPTANLSHLMIVAAIAAKEGRKVKTVDISGAYLNADMSHAGVIMELDKVLAGLLCSVDSSYSEFLREDGTMIVELQKALYGCIESAKLWYDLLSETLLQDGFVKNALDHCVFNKMVDGVQITVVLYVDDLFITSVSDPAMDQLVFLLRSKFKEITIHDGKVHSYLGITWDFSSSLSVKVSMDGYTNDLLEFSGVTGDVKTPATDQLFAIRAATPLDADAKASFHTLVAKLLYLAKRTRPDVLLPVSFLTTRVQKPDEDDLNKLNRVLKYLNGTKELGIVLTVQDPIRIQAFIDASYGVHEDGKSHSGLVVTLGGGPILTKSTKQRLVTKSSTEAELVAASDFASEALASREFLIAQGHAVDPAVVLQDNQSTIAMLDNGISKSDRTRHIAIRYFWTKERVDNGEMQVSYVGTDEMTADVLTKPLQGEKFLKLRAKLLNWIV